MDKEKAHSIKSLFSLEEKIAIVTGGFSGIGRAAGYALAVSGATVILGDFANPEEGKRIAKDLTNNGYQCESQYLNVCSSENINQLCRYVYKKYNKIDIFVNNAGILRDGLITEISDEEWDCVVKTNLTGTFYCCREAIRYMRNHGGSIINVASVGGKMPSAVTGVHYCSSKGGVMALTRSLCMQEGNHGIRINAIAPGTTATELLQSRSEDAIKRASTGYPLKRLGQPEEVAAVILFLASDASSYVNGETFDINGGYYMD